MGSADSRFAVLEYQALRRRRGKLFGGQQKYIRGGLAVADLVAEDEGIEAGAKIVLIQKLDRPLPGAGGGDSRPDAPGSKVGKKRLCPGLEGCAAGKELPLQGVGLSHDLRLGQGKAIAGNDRCGILHFRFAAIVGGVFRHGEILAKGF